MFIFTELLLEVKSVKIYSCRLYIHLLHYALNCWSQPGSKCCLLGEAHNEMKFYCVQKFIFFISYPLYFWPKYVSLFYVKWSMFLIYVLPVSQTCIASELINPKERMYEHIC